MLKARTTHLIDIENLCMASNPTLEQVIEARRSYRDLVKPGDNDQFFVTVNSKHNLAAAIPYRVWTKKSASSTDPG